MMELNCLHIIVILNSKYWEPFQVKITNRFTESIEEQPS